MVSPSGSTQREKGFPPRVLSILPLLKVPSFFAAFSARFSFSVLPGFFLLSRCWVSLPLVMFISKAACAAHDEGCGTGKNSTTGTGNDSIQGNAQAIVNQTGDHRSAAFE